MFYRFEENFSNEIEMMMMQLRKILYIIVNSAKIIQYLSPTLAESKYSYIHGHDA
jgi:hypothetical protein